MVGGCGFYSYDLVLRPEVALVNVVMILGGPLKGEEFLY
jgi:hypothetical protein